MAVVTWKHCATIHWSKKYNSQVLSVMSSLDVFFVHPERLPPTSSSIKIHCLRVYYQIMVWMGTDDGMDALVWGWTVDNNQMVLIMTDKKAALITD